MWHEKQQSTLANPGTNAYQRTHMQVLTSDLARDPVSLLRFELDQGVLPKLLSFFGLKQQPFGVTPDPSFLYLSRTHRDALSSLVHGIETGRGFLALIAKPGMGKTTLLFHLLEKFKNSASSAFVFQTQCNSRELLEFLLSDLGFENRGQDFVRMLEDFNQQLVRQVLAGKRFIVLLDEAQNLDASVLETIRLLSNFETPTAKLLQIVLTGQPELANKLARPDMVQLQQRLSSLIRLEPFSASETEQYIQHRLRVSGYSGSRLLTPEALAIVTKFAQGTPRIVNNVCFNALAKAFESEKKHIDAEIADDVVRDLDISRQLETSHSNRPPLETSLSDRAPLNSFRSEGQIVSNGERPGLVDTSAPVQPKNGAKPNAPRLLVSSASDTTSARPNNTSGAVGNVSDLSQDLSQDHVEERSSPRHESKKEPLQTADSKRTFSSASDKSDPGGSHSDSRQPSFFQNRNNQTLPISAAKEYIDDFMRGLRNKQKH
jgi:type II secretory pathway predicted ATPase ExeA